MPSGLFGATSSPVNSTRSRWPWPGSVGAVVDTLRGQNAVDLAVMIADGGAAISDVRTLSDQVLLHSLWPQRRRPGVC